MIKIISTVAAVALLAGCAGQGMPPVAGAAAPVDPVTALANFTVADLQAADTIAVASNDEIAHACYPALVKFVQSFPSVSGTQTVKGAVSAFELARSKRLQVQGAVGSGMPNYLKLGCAALVQDETVFIAKLAAMAAGTAVAGPAAPALLGALPIPLP